MDYGFIVIEQKKIKVDVICPIFYVDLGCFETIIKSWYHHIPINRLLIGIGKKNNKLLKILKKYPNVEIIDQTSYKTLGYCLQELFESVETEYFVYLHCDVELGESWFEKMWRSRVEGILESIKHPSFGPEALIQAKKYRAYSGAQLIYAKSIENLNFEDDYIYCNEDAILQNIVLKRGFSYTKIHVFHNHYRMLGKRTQSEKTILEWQWRGILKYAYPSSRLLPYIHSILNILAHQHGCRYNLREEIENINPKWLPLLN